MYLAHREKTTLDKFESAINKALRFQKDKGDFTYQYDIVNSQEYPEMSIVDYMIWALQRYIVKGEGRFFKALIDKYSLIIDLYDKANYKGKQNYYWAKNQFSLEKASDFKT